ncbi:MAG: hypothetical protein RL757_1279 [Bacteroidota bacterium]|jgi:hypothetical protein
MDLSFQLSEKNDTFVAIFIKKIISKKFYIHFLHVTKKKLGYQCSI